MALKKANDHWAFLEEIEAPMWVDLTLEVKINNQHTHDEWFHTSHLFHQRSSHQLKSAFSHCGESTLTLDFESQVSTSPKLPLSVSRSRGKDYRSKKWRAENYESLHKQHPLKVLSGTSSCLDLRFGEELKSKSINLKGTSRSKSTLVCKSSLTGNAIPSSSKHAVSTFEDQANGSSSMGNRTCESNTRSTVTSQSSQQRELKCIEVSTQPFGPSGLLSNQRISSRKDCVTRQASRVEINNDKRLSRGYKSSSGKSSVGSSSNILYDVKSLTSTSIGHKEITPSSRNVARTSYVAKNKVKTSNVSKASTIAIEEGSSNSRRGIKISILKPAHEEATKPKVQHQTLQPLRVNARELSMAAIKSKEKLRAVRPNRSAGVGKENATGRMIINQKCSGKGTSALAMVRGQKGTKQLGQKGGAGLVGSKVKVTDRFEKNKAANVNQRVCLR
ncbi:uncharacterized protein LOC109013959 isoform X2 [Juglans regia]|uniref:Uncharacterized protein LOC109013959 isoform X2 n=1 Tax=Juglans regia TaxID=51240 RepID=A0A6P9E7I6_JUGRE|nr:uncharacterized protein LOC109013959 isoform X2 [Juglans regia]